MRLIDADIMMELVGRLPFRNNEDIKNFIEVQPTVDAVEVVRCENCRWGRKTCGNVECQVDLNVPPEYHGYEWFCPNGER